MRIIKRKKKKESQKILDNLEGGLDQFFSYSFLMYIYISSLINYLQLHLLLLEVDLVRLVLLQVELWGFHLALTADLDIEYRRELPVVRHDREVLRGGEEEGNFSG